METSDQTAHQRLHEQGFRCRIPAVKPLLNGRQTTEAAEVVQREERRKKKDDRAMVFSHVFRRVQVCYFFWKQRSQSVEEKRVNGT